jgi:site-specific DNA recombinase
MCLDGGSPLPTLQSLKALGWKTRRYETAKGTWCGGAEFDKSALQKLPTNVVYLGKVTYKGEVYEGEHEAIVNKDMFAHMQGPLHAPVNERKCTSGPLSPLARV